MQIEEIRKRIEELEAQHGGWTTDNICLGKDLYTVGPPQRHEPGTPYTPAEGVDPRVRTFVQAVADLVGAPLKGLQVLDLAPGEGLMATEFALQGAAVTAAAPSEAGREKLAFLKEALSLKKLEVVAQDVCHFQVDKPATFDVILCAGVLDRLDPANLFPVVTHAAEACRRLLLVDTHISLADREAYVYHGQIYWGRTVQPAEAEEHGLPSVDGSVGAEEHSPAFWLTRPSLLNLLRHLGFTSVFECHNPMGYVYADRHLFVALKGKQATLHAAPLLNEPEDDWPEKIHLSAPPHENADVYLGHEELVSNYHHLQALYEELYERHAPFTYLGGILRQLPRVFWQALRRRLPVARPLKEPVLPSREPTE